MLLFLHNIRATLIPTLAVPVVLLGTFGIMALLGFSINTLTMLAMVLAIGLLVDDAIVVVENVERIMRDEHLGPKEATKKRSEENTSELQSLMRISYAVFCLKKKTHKKTVYRVHDISLYSNQQKCTH